jgi:hypothetical protein
MKFKVGDKAIYIGFNDGIYERPNAWKLERLKEYTIDNCAFEMNKDTGMFYAVSDDKGTHTSWYKEKDFISIVEARKKKLEQIERYNN